MSLRRAWQLVHEYWFGVLVVGGLAWWLADVAVYVHRGSGPEGPLWFDVLAVLAFTTPFFFRRRHPIGALLAILSAIALASFVDGRLVVNPFVSFLFALAICFLFGTRPARAQSVAGLALTIAVAGLVTINDPQGHVGDFVWDAITFTIAWIVGFAVGEKYREVDQAKERAARAEREREPN